MNLLREALVREAGTERGDDEPQPQERQDQHADPETDRGAATVGFANNPRAIMNHGVLRQLDMVDKYFEETGLRNYGPVSLDDLYLTVLTPAARNETRPNVALNIQGQQAAYLHVNRDVRAPITRNSILAGLHQNANDRLFGNSQTAQQRNNALQAARMSAYAEQASVTQVR